MGIEVRNFIIENRHLGLAGTASLDYDGLRKLSDEEFEEFYRENMNRYDCWEQGIKPQRFRCHESIESPEQMRRYIGQTLHPDCFRQTWEEERKKEINKNRMEYFDRVASIRD